MNTDWWNTYNPTFEYIVTAIVALCILIPSVIFVVKTIKEFKR